PITLQGLIAYDYILHRFQKEKTDRMIISAADILKAVNLENNHDEIYKYLDSLQQTRIESRDAKGKLWGAFNLLAVFQKRDQGIFVQIPEPIFKALELKDENKKESLYYTAIKLLEKRAFRCVYSVIFYDIFKKYEKINLPIFTVDELKELTGTSQKYQIYYEFKRNVLEKALKELNDFDQKFEYNFSEERLGRKIEKIKFFKVEKNVIDILENEISEKMKTAILKARKNRYIDTSYSQKAMNRIIQRYDEKDIIKALNELSKYNSEIINFSKILNSKIKDIVDSKKVKPKKEVVKVVEPKVEVLEKSELDLEKEKLSVLIFKIDLPTRERIMLFGELSVIEKLEDLKKLEKRIVAGTITTEFRKN
ncbi:MAG: hypothetical protein ACRC0G_11695, partial [Fusobacteriaceae bacterium]